jgi:hypothetical protein
LYGGAAATGAAALAAGTAPSATSISPRDIPSKERTDVFVIA